MVKRLFLVMGLAVLGLFMSLISLQAGQTSAIQVTVTIPSTISVSVNPTIWAIGNVSLGETKSTADNYFTATNDGNVAEDFTIETSNSADWNAGDSAGSETFVMSAKGGDLTNWTNIHPQKTLKTNVAKDGTVSFALQFTAPT